MAEWLGRSAPGLFPGFRPSRRLFLRAVALLVLATGLSPARTLLGAAEPIRVVSQTVGTDELLLALADPEQIAALSHLAGDPNFSAVGAEAAPYPKLDRNADAEGILKYHPTLVLFADYSRLELVEQVRRTGVTVIVFDRYHTLEDAFHNLRVLGRALGPAAEARAEKIIADSQAIVDDLARRLEGAPRPRVIAPSTYGVIPGAQTTFQNLCDHAGAENLAATRAGLVGHQPPPVEQMLAWPIDYLVVAGDSLEQALAPYRELPPYAFMPALREGRAVLLEPWQLSCVTHHRVRGYLTLARALHPERFEP
ncbi:MAG: ABC transporter substrate-binding protein [Verrucomicrobia bacterium]|nr:MAG: ABC transporter substrate-binding protein [Verrucomicrobiota bacterium]